MVRRSKADAEQTRELILKAAETVFYRQGVANTTLEQIAAEAGVTRGAIYWHFKNKAEIFKTMRDQLILLHEEIVSKAMEEHHEDPLATLERVTIDGFRALTTCEHRRRAYSILFCKCEITGEIADMMERQELAGKELRHSVADAFRLSAEKGVLHPSWPPDLAARAFDCLTLGLIYEWLRFGQPFDLARVGADVLSAFIRSVRSTHRSESAAAAAKPLA